MNFSTIEVSEVTKVIVFERTCARDVFVRYDIIQCHRTILLYPEYTIRWVCSLSFVGDAYHGKFSSSVCMYASPFVAFPFPLNLKTGTERSSSIGTSSSLDMVVEM